MLIIICYFLSNIYLILKAFVGVSVSNYLEIKFSKITTQMTDLNDAIKKVDDEIKEMETKKIN